MTNPPNLSYKPKNTILRFLGAVLQSLGLDLEFCLSNNTLVVFFFKNYLPHFPGICNNEDLNICSKFLHILLALVRYICVPNLTLLFVVLKDSTTEITTPFFFF